MKPDHHNLNLIRMRNFYSLIPYIIIAFILSLVQPSGEQTKQKVKLTKQERIDGAIKDNLFTSSDIETGKIPFNKLFKAIEEGNRRIAISSSNRSGPETIANAKWRERGPNNIGGRTRAIMVDESDPNRNRIWAGGVSGGLWRTEDITQDDPQWTKLGLLFESIAIADIAQDPNDHNIIYVGTGESYTGVVPGVGLFKTTDDGENWELLASTKGSIFRDINEVYVHSNSDVYVGTSAAGLFKSVDGGNTWLKVLGVGVGATNDNIHDIFFNESNQTFYASNDNSVFRSSTGNSLQWSNIGNIRPGFPSNLERAELAVCPANPDIMYVLGAINNRASSTYVSTNGGNTWSSKPTPGFNPNGDFTNGQAWYDLEIEVDPFNCDRIFAGGVTMYVSTFQGNGWSQVNEGNVLGGTEFHPDHHGVVYDPKKPGRVYFTNDGGIWMSNNSGGQLINKNLGYITTQFYCAAIHPEEGSPYLIGGTQDNRSLQLTEPGVSPGEIVWGGDGMFCFIDQNEPNIQIVSSQFGNYGVSFDGGVNFGFGAEVNGEFVHRSGYDDEANILYGQSYMDDYFRWDVITGTTETVDLTGVDIAVSAVRADPFVPNRIYLGGDGGRVIRVDNAHDGPSIDTADIKVIADFPGNASISSIYMDKQTPDDMLVSRFNYGGLLENLFVTYDGGVEWDAIEGDLPDLPVRWAIFDPSNHDRVMIATDAGVWTTDDVDGDFTHWVPSTPANGMPFVRVDMLLVRESDKVVLAATHGRGLMTTDIFSAAAPVITTRAVAYEDQIIIIDGSQSVNAESYHWDLGDNTTSQQEKVTHTYSAPGTYTISLTINGEITKSRTITVLPYLPAPFKPGVTDYSGDFESHPEHFAAFTVQGTGFERGVSTKPGKDGTHSGTSAWVLGINDNVYQNNTRAEFYTPQYDLTEHGLYELKFWSKYALQNRNDGFQVEYSIDSGESWQQLGSKSDPGWYNYYNINLVDGAFPVNKSYFTNAQLNWTHYVKDISFLGGQSRVSFRYVFRSDGSEQAQGLAIDDFEVTKFEGELKTTITNFEASYTGEQEVTINFTTGIEYNADKFIIERSFTGFAFDEIAQVNARGVITTVPQAYVWKDQSLRNVIYYRVKAINDNPDLNYHLEFYSDVIVVRRDIEPGIVHQVLTNPFKDRIYVSFSSVINQDITLRLFDTAGRMIREEKETPNSVGMELDHLDLTPGIYILSIQVADGEPSTYKLFTEGR